MIKYTITCPNCGEEKEFEKKKPSGYERQFCSRSCANKAIWTPEKRAIASEQSKVVAAGRDMGEVAKTRWAKLGAKEEHSEAMKDKWTEPEFYEMMCEKRKIACNDPGYRVQRSIIMTELWEDEAYREKQQISRRQAWQDPERRKEQSKRSRNYWANPEAHEKQSQLMLDYWADPDYRANMEEVRQDPEIRASISQKIKLLWEDSVYREHQCKAFQAVWDNPEYREQLTIKRQQQWFDPAYQQAWARGINRRPTKPELELFYLLNTNDFPYAYIGDGGLWIGGKNPDFIWPEQRRIVEMFGSYWHNESEIEPRTKLFAEYGFDTLIIWDYELDDEIQLLTRLREFHQGEKLIE